MRELSGGFGWWNIQWQIQLIASTLFPSSLSSRYPALCWPIQVCGQAEKRAGKVDHLKRKTLFLLGWCSARSVPQPALHTPSPVRAVHSVPVGMRWISEEQGYPQSVLIIMDFGAWCHVLQTCLSKIGVTLITSQSRNEQQQPLKWHQCSAPLPETWDTRSFVSRLHSSFPLL